MKDWLKNIDKKSLVDAVVLILVAIFLASFFTPNLIFLKTTTTGGDTGSHYPTAVYLKEVLLPKLKIMGWDQGNYAGYPVFYHYFPLSFLLMCFLNIFISMQIAFKIVSVLGTYLLPLFVYFAFRFLKYPFPIPAIASVFTLPFLFMEANSMWGGNIPSTLAGEYSYSLSLALMILFFGSLYSGIREKNKIIFNSILVVFIGLSHAFTLIFSGVIALYFLLTKEYIIENFKYLFKVYGLAGLLLSFWLLPFLGNLSYVTSYVTRWGINSIFEVIPLILIPFIIFAIVAFFLNLFDKRTRYFAYIIFSCLVLYIIAPSIGMLDIRLVPFIQLFLLIFAATLPMIFLSGIKAVEQLPIIIFISVILWVLPNVTFIKAWIKWNYEGFENKPAWTLYKNINDYLAKSSKGRVVYEHSPAHNVFGTERAFENLPYFAKRYTLEGLYMQSSISSPFVFYIQSEISKVCSGPFPQYKYTSLNLQSAIPKLKIFNVTEYIARSPEAKKMARLVPDLLLEKTFGDYEIYRIKGSDGHYVVPLESPPVFVSPDNWKKSFFAWFIDNDLNRTPLVYIKDRTIKENIPIPAAKLPKHNPIKEEIKDEEIAFDTDLIGYPHMIKVSYHPNWQVEGADKIYLISPSFMLVYPNKNHVKLYFGKSGYNYAGEILSLFGLIIVVISGIISIVHARKTKAVNINTGP